MIVRVRLLVAGATPGPRAGRFERDEPLDERGRASVLAVAAVRRPPHSATLALASPTLAARETARLLGYDATPVAALADLDVGEWRGVALAEVAARDPDGLAAWTRDAEARPHGGESVAELLARVAAWLDGLDSAASPEGGRIDAVTHAAVVRAAIVHALGAPAASFRRLEAEPLHRTDLTFDGRRWSVRSTNVPL